MRGVRGLAVLFSAALALAIATTANADVVWLCKPRAEPNPCVGDLTTTIQRPDGTDKVLPGTIPRGRRIDCFYVYPTVSEDPGTNSDKSIDPEMEAIARFQAQRFSRHCRVYAPVYRQRTVAALLSGSSSPEPYNVAFADVVEAWKDYRANYNHGRGFALIGHSQGTRMLRGLIRNYIDDRPSVRRRLVGAFILGGNVLVRKGRNAHGDFDNVPGCRRPGQFRCVVAWSAFNEPPPADSRFGRSPATPDTSDLGLPSGPDYEVLCTDPERLTGGSGQLTTLTRSGPHPGLIGLAIRHTYGGSPPTASTPWLRARERYTGRCTSANGANYLNVQPIGNARHLNPSPDATWGLHVLDVNIAYGELEQILAAQTATYLAARGY